MYQALYRKYRPKSFEDVIDQDVVIKILKKSIVSKKISHAYLFTGPRGSGKTTIAKIFAKMINCQNLDGSKICNKCVFCTQKENEMLDIVEIDAASNNGVDEIREINNKVNLVPTLGKYKVYIIDEVHMLTIGAFNALLKTLEEPPAHIIFILATTDPQKMPMTILSRCQRFDFKKISEEGIYERILHISLKENFEIEDEAITEIAKMSDGSLRDALVTLDQAINYADEKIKLEDIFDINGIIRKEELENFLIDLLDNNVFELFAKIEKYNNNGKNLSKIIESLINLVKNIVLLNLKQETYELNEKFKIKKSSILIKILEELNIILNNMKKGTNFKLIFEIGILKICEFNQSDKVENLEKNIFIKAEKKEIVNKTSIISKASENLDISQEIKIDPNNKMNHFKKVRINNVLASFSKTKTTFLKTNIKQLNDYLLDDKIGIYAEMILDGVIKAANEDSIIFVFKTENISDIFNRKIIELEKVLEKVLKEKYKIISTYESDWEIIKRNFNSKKEIYYYIEENFSLEEIFKNEYLENNLTSFFSELVEYK